MEKTRRNDVNAIGMGCRPTLRHGSCPWQQFHDIHSNLKVDGFRLPGRPQRGPAGCWRRRRERGGTGIERRGPRCCEAPSCWTHPSHDERHRYGTAETRKQTWIRTRGTDTDTGRRTRVWTRTQHHDPQRGGSATSQVTTRRPGSIKSNSRRGPGLEVQTGKKT